MNITEVNITNLANLFVNGQGITDFTVGIIFGAILCIEKLIPMDFATANDIC